MMRPCKKVCYATKAKARKAVKRMSGRNHHRERVIYPCDRWYHEGMYHLTSRRVPNGDQAQEQTMDQDQPQEEQDSEGPSADVPPVPRETLEPSAPQTEQQASDPTR